MKDYILEVCVDTLESAKNAVFGGANRLELCAGLVIGGVSASPSLYRQIRRESDIAVHAMVRPRFGDFLYTGAEMEQMLDEVKLWRQLGAEGIVCGILTADGNLDVPRMLMLREAAGDGMNITLNRAFDVARDPLQTLEDAKRAGVTAILTSGQAPKAAGGTSLIAQLVAYAGGVQIMPGGGLGPANVAEVRRRTGAAAYHLSGNVVKDSPMRFRRPDICMGVPGISEFGRWECSAAAVAAVKQVLEAIQ